MFKKSILCVVILLGIGQGFAIVPQPLGGSPLVVCENSKIKFFYLQGALPIATKTLVLKSGNRLEIESAVAAKEISVLLAKRVPTTILFKRSLAAESFVLFVNFDGYNKKVLIYGAWEEVPANVLEFAKVFVIQKSGARLAAETTAKVVGGAVVAGLSLFALGRGRKHLLEADKSVAKNCKTTAFEGQQNQQQCDAEPENELANTPYLDRSSEPTPLTLESLWRMMHDLKSSDDISPLDSYEREKWLSSLDKLAFDAISQDRDFFQRLGQYNATFANLIRYFCDKYAARLLLQDFSNQVKKINLWRKTKQDYEDYLAEYDLACKSYAAVEASYSALENKLDQGVSLNREERNELNSGYNAYNRRRNAYGLLERKKVYVINLASNFTHQPQSLADSLSIIEREIATHGAQPVVSSRIILALEYGGIMKLLNTLSQSVSADTDQFCLQVIDVLYLGSCRKGLAANLLLFTKFPSSRSCGLLAAVIMLLAQRL